MRSGINAQLHVYQMTHIFEHIILTKQFCEMATVNSKERKEEKCTHLESKCLILKSYEHSSPTISSRILKCLYQSVTLYEIVDSSCGKMVQLFISTKYNSLIL